MVFLHSVVSFKVHIKCPTYHKNIYRLVHGFFTYEVRIKCPTFIYFLPGYGFKAEYVILLFNCPTNWRGRREPVDARRRYAQPNVAPSFTRTAITVQ